MAYRLRVTADSFSGAFPTGSTHEFTGLPLTEDGWTDYETMLEAGYGGARVMFVSNAGNNATAGPNGDSTDWYDITDLTFDSDGLFQAVESINAYATIAGAMADLRDGFPDIILLNRGDSWTESIDSGAKSGVSQTVRAIVSSYGSGAKPIISESGIDLTGSDFFIVANIENSSADWTSSQEGLNITGDSTHILVEDIFFDQKDEDQIDGIAGQVQYICVRRCVYTHYQAHDGFTYCARGDNILFEEDVFHEPWDSGSSDHGRHLYLSPAGGAENQELTNMTVRRCIGYRSERGSFDARCAGTLSDNLMLQCDGLGFGGGGGSRESIQSGSVVNNVFMQGTPNLNKLPAIEVRNIDTATIRGNIWTDPRGIVDVNQTMIDVSPTATQVELQVLIDVEITENIVYNFDASDGAHAITASSYDTQTGNTITDNDFQFGTGSEEIMRMNGGVSGITFSGNRYYSSSAEPHFIPGDGSYSDWVTQTGETGSSFTQVSYSDPDRTIDTYMTSISNPGDADDFMDVAIAQSRTNWDADYTANAVNNYIRAGFDKSAVAVTY